MWKQEFGHRKNENELMFDYDDDDNVTGVKYLRSTFMQKEE